jgi:hypothetical protein
MLRRESVSGSLGGVAAPGGRAVGSENRAHRPLVPTGRDTRRLSENPSAASLLAIERNEAGGAPCPLMNWHK